MSPIYSMVAPIAYIIVLQTLFLKHIPALTLRSSSIRLETSGKISSITENMMVLSLSWSFISKFCSSRLLIIVSKKNFDIFPLNYPLFRYTRLISFRNCKTIIRILKFASVSSFCSTTINCRSCPGARTTWFRKSLTWELWANLRFGETIILSILAPVLPKFFIRK